MELQDMTITDKANILEALIAKADLDPEYSIQVDWHNSQQEAKQNCRVMIENVRTIFQTGKIDSLDYDVRANASEKYNAQLDDLLKMFPEYSRLETINANQNARHM